MSIDDIREMVAKSQMEQTVAAVLQITAADDLKNLGIEISRSYRSYKQNLISGILSFDQQTLELAKISNRILQLLNEYELTQIRFLKVNIGQLKNDLEKADLPDSGELVKELNEIEEGLKDSDTMESKKDIKRTVAKKIKDLQVKLADPDSSESKIVHKVKEGFKIAGQIISIIKMVII